MPLALQPLLLLVNLTGLKNPHQMSWERACSSAGAFDLAVSLVLPSSSTVVESVSDDEEMVVGDTDDVPGPQKKERQRFFPVTEDNMKLTWAKYE